jgi:rifampicin phosphotransferase
VNPDHYAVETATARILPPGRHDVGRKPSLAGAQLRELASLGDAAQRLFGAPQDVEWVIDAGGKIWLTQSRPITTLYPLPGPSPDAPNGPGAGSPAEVRVYLCGTLLQGLTRPITPMGLSVLGRMQDDSETWRYASPGLRMYVDLTPLLRSRSGRRVLLKVLPLADGRSGAILPALLEDPRFGVIGRPRGKPARKDRSKRPSQGPRLNARTAGLTQIAEFIPGVLRALIRPEAELRRARNFGKRLAAELACPNPPVPPAGSNTPNGSRPGRWRG